MVTTMSTLDVREIIQKAGGPKGLHAHMRDLVRTKKLRPDQAVAEKSIYSWFEIGIPERHWSFVMSACEVTESDLHKANEALRKQSQKSRPKRQSERAAA
jgi:hypothetical protein